MECSLHTKALCKRLHSKNYQEKSFAKFNENKKKRKIEIQRKDIVNLHADDLRGRKIEAGGRKCALHTIRPSNLIKCGTRRLC